MHPLLADIQQGSFRALARALSLTENQSEGYDEILLNLRPNNQVTVLGFTGPPGAGKSTLVNALIAEMVNAGKKVGVLCVDPSSPFNYGALLGDRIRMNKWYNNAHVFIRSLASRGSMGGLNPHIIEMTDVMRSANFDYIIVETIGVGQTEVEIAGLADLTIIVLVPESGDDIQLMKAGLMETGDIFVVNKADRPGADIFLNSLKKMLAPTGNHNREAVPVLKTSAINDEGVAGLFITLQAAIHHNNSSKKYWLLAEKAFQLIQARRMKDIDKKELYGRIKTNIESGGNFNLYRFTETFK